MTGLQRELQHPQAHPRSSALGSSSRRQGLEQRRTSSCSDLSRLSRAVVSSIQSSQDSKDGNRSSGILRKSGSTLTKVSLDRKPSVASSSKPPAPPKLSRPSATAPVAAPRASYRPLKLTAESDDEDDDTAGKASASRREAPVSPTFGPPLSPSFVPQRVAAKSSLPKRNAVKKQSLGILKEYSTPTEGPPVIPLGFAKFLSAPRWPRPTTIYTRTDGSSSAPDLALEDANDRVIAAPASIMPLPNLKRTDSSSSRSKTRSKIPPSALALQPPLSQTLLPKRRPSWLRRQGRRSSTDAVNAPSSPTMEQPPTIQEEPEYVPLHRDCICKYCLGRISAGRSPNYVPHWSKGARAKWLTARAQAEQGIDAGERLKMRALAASGTQTGSTAFGREPPSLIVPRSTRSPPPLGEMQSEPSLPSRGSVTATLLEDATIHQDEDDLAEAGADLQRILGGSQDDAPIRSVDCPSLLQVDEVDKKLGEASRPRGMGTSSALIEAADNLHSARLVDTPSPGVRPEEALSMDTGLIGQVDAALAERAEHQRTEKAKRRGGARGMLAQLEEADRVEERAKVRRRSSGNEGQPQPAVGAAQAPHPSSRTSSPGLYEPPQRTGSPLMERLRGAVRTSNSPSTTPPLRAPSPLGRQTSYNGKYTSSPILPSNTSLAPDLRPIVRTPSPFVPTSPRIDEEVNDFTENGKRHTTANLLSIADQLPAQRSNKASSGHHKSASESLGLGGAFKAAIGLHSPSNSSGMAAAGGSMAGFAALSPSASRESKGTSGAPASSISLGKVASSGGDFGSLSSTSSTKPLQRSKSSSDGRSHGGRVPTSSKPSTGNARPSSNAIPGGRSTSAGAVTGAGVEGSSNGSSKGAAVEPKRKKGLQRRLSAPLNVARGIFGRREGGAE